jgi:hypothetical protein
MAWEIYALIITVIAWLLNIFIQHLIDRRKILNDFYEKTKIPISIEMGLINKNNIKFAYTNCADRSIIGFNVTISVFNKATNTFDYPTHYVECLNELRKYESRFIKIEATSMDVTKNEIKDFFVETVLFDDGTVWKKKVN